MQTEIRFWDTGNEREGKLIAIIKPQVSIYDSNITLWGFYLYHIKAYNADEKYL